MVHLRVPSGWPWAGLGWSVTVLVGSVLPLIKHPCLPQQDEGDCCETGHHGREDRAVPGELSSVCRGRGACPAAGARTQPSPPHLACQAAKRELKGNLVDKLTMTPKQIRQKAKSA